MDRKDFPFASVELLSAGVSCLLVLGKGAAVLAGGEIACEKVFLC